MLHVRTWTKRWLGDGFWRNLWQFARSFCPSPSAIWAPLANQPTEKTSLRCRWCLWGLDFLRVLYQEKKIPKIQNRKLFQQKGEQFFFFFFFLNFSQQQNLLWVYCFFSLFFISDPLNFQVPWDFLGTPALVERARVSVPVVPVEQVRCWITGKRNKSFTDLADWTANLLMKSYEHEKMMKNARPFFRVTKG